MACYRPRHPGPRTKSWLVFDPPLAFGWILCLQDLDYWRTSIAQEKEQLHRLWDRCAPTCVLPACRVGLGTNRCTAAGPFVLLNAAPAPPPLWCTSSIFFKCQSTAHPSTHPRSLSYINECIKRARRDIGQLQQRKAALEQATRWRPNVRRT